MLSFQIERIISLGWAWDEPRCFFSFANEKVSILVEANLPYIEEFDYVPTYTYKIDTHPIFLERVSNLFQTKAYIY